MTIRAEIASLLEQEKLTLSDMSRPLKERMEEVDFIRERLSRADKEVNDIQEEIAKEVAEVSHMMAEMEGRGIVVSLREEVDALKERLANLPMLVSDTVSRTKVRSSGVGVWPVVLVFILVLAAGAVGYFFPLPTETASQANSRALVEAASIYQVSGESDDAKRVLDEAVKAGIDDPILLARVGQIYYSLKEYRKAADVLAIAIRDVKTQVPRLNLARSYGKLGKHQDAIAIYEELIKLDPNNVLFYTEMGNRYESLQRLADAEAQYQKAISVAPNRYEGYYNLAQLYRLKTLDFDKAAEQYLLALQKSPTYYLAQVYYGASLTGQGKYEEAIVALNDAIKMNSEGQSAPLYMGEVYQALEQYEDAIAWYERALELGPSSIQVLMDLGKTYIAMGDCGKATLPFAEVLKIQPSNQDAQAFLSQCASR